MALLTDKVVLVSGGTQGVGAAVARAAAREGAAVAVTGRRAGLGEGLVAELVQAGADAAYVKADLAQVDDVRRAVADVVARFGVVDSLVNSAATTTRGT